MREMDPQKIRQIEHAGRELAAVLERVLKEHFTKGGEKWGFADRASMVKTMQEFIARNPPDQTSEQRS